MSEKTSKKVFYDLEVYVDEIVYEITFDDMKFLLDYINDLCHYFFKPDLFISRREIEVEPSICDKCACECKSKNSMIACVNYAKAKA